MKRFFVLLLSAMLFFSCAKPYERVQVESVALKSVTPTGLRTMNMVLALTVDNHGPAFELKDPVVTVKLSGTPLLILTTDSLVVRKRSKESFDCAIRAELAGNHNILSVMSVLGGSVDPDAATVDISFRFGRPGRNGMKFELKNRPAGKLLEKLI